ncbi:DUF202 domain-containing protein [Nocardia sp. NPDC127526]|uniref:DUF202 domain-containing protein n=1 Tax=Nocardia sp. NPDC127526 TaxID=3345393 RepID=UPI003630D9C1
MTSPEAGLAAERTALAWWRTAIGSMANLVLFVHAAFTVDWRPVSVLCFVATGALAVVTVVCVRRSRVLHSHKKGDWGDGTRAVTFVATAITGVVLTAFAMALAYALHLP